MEDQEKTNEQLVRELEQLRQRIAALEALVGENERTEKILQGSLEFTQTLIEVNPEATIVIDEKCRVVLANRVAREMAGRDDSVSKCLTCYRVFHGRTAPCEELGDQCPLVQIIATKAPMTTTHIHRGPHGSDVAVEIRAAPILDQSGEVVQIVMTYRDITDRKRVEQALRLTQFSVDHAGDAVFWLCPDGSFTYANAMACRNLGYSHEELLSMTVHDIDPNFPAEVWPEHWEELKRRGSFTFESVHHSKDGEEFPVEITVNYLAFKGKEYNCAFARDVTERKLAQEALQRANDELEIQVEQRTAELRRSNRDLAHFAFTASHDLQEPLRMISTYLKTLQREHGDSLAEQARIWIELSLDSGRWMQRLIDDLLSYAHVGTRERHFEALDANEIVDQVMTYLQALIESNSAVVTHDELPTVTADLTLMTELFQNLISNAIKFHSQESPHVHISAQQAGSEWVFCVRDNGIGIDPKYMDRIFAVFERLHPSDQYGGNGIGLAVCKRVTERHGGRIWCESEQGKGTKFFFSVPKSRGSRP